MKALLSAIVAACLWMAAGPASALQVKFYPAHRVYAYELDAAHGASGLMLHNIAIMNDGDAPVDVRDVTIELMQGERALDTRALGVEELTRSAAGAAQLQQAGLIQTLAFQFGGDALIDTHTTLSPDLRLDPGEALLLTANVFAYRGARDAVRVRVNGDAAEGWLPIRTGATQIVYQVPLAGQWYNGAGATFHSHHRWSPMEEFGFDFLRLGPDFRTHSGDGTRFTDYHAYGQAVYAAAEGRVVRAIADQQEDARAMAQPGESVEAYMTRLQQDQMTRLALGAPGIVGNSVVIDHGNGEFSVYAHLKPGSVRVHTGDRVTRGQQIGEVGSSGNSTEPHLHFQVCDSPDPLMCAGIPVQFEPSAGLFPDLPRMPQTGDFMSRPNAP